MLDHKVNVNHGVRIIDPRRRPYNLQLAVIHGAIRRNRSNTVDRTANVLETSEQEM